MAKMTFKTGDEYAMKLSKLAKQSDEVARKAIYAGAKIVADEIKRNIQSLPEEKYRHLKSLSVRERGFKLRNHVG